MSRYARVITAYENAYPDPISGERGDVFRLGQKDEHYPEFIWATAADGRRGWVPQSYLRRNGDHGRLIRDYTAQELTVDEDELVEIQDAIGGWVWVATADGYQGWIPAGSVALKAASSSLSGANSGSVARSKEAGEC